MSDDLIERLQRADEYEPLGHDGWEAATALAEAHATIARLEEALAHIDALDPEGMIDGCSQAATRGLVLRMGQIARAALSNKPDASPSQPLPPVRQTPP